MKGTNNDAKLAIPIKASEQTYLQRWAAKESCELQSQIWTESISSSKWAAKENTQKKGKITI